LNWHKIRPFIQASGGITLRIPKNLNRESILQAIKEVDRDGFPPDRQSRKWDVLYKNNKYPPKYLISLANKFLNGVELSPKKFSGGPEANEFLKDLRFTIVSKTEKEKNRRLELWKKIGGDKATDVNPQVLRKLGIYGGFQGIWVDKVPTQKFSDSGKGITVSFLHTGKHYPDDLSDDGLIYHYPKTNRKGQKDLNEINASKEAYECGLPIFIILPGRNSDKTRYVKLGWIIDWSDKEQLFLVSFSDKDLPSLKPKSKDDPFKLTDSKKGKKQITTSRPNQTRFRFDVLKRSGSKCSVCDIQIKELLVAAHVRDKKANGSDDERNGLILCWNHHTAFDNYLFGIDPKNLKIIPQNNHVKLSSLGITVNVLTPEKEPPHPKALEWKWKKFKNFGSK